MPLYTRLGVEKCRGLGLVTQMQQMQQMQMPRYLTKLHVGMLVHRRQGWLDSNES
jgi:hypothetical protein